MEKYQKLHLSEQILSPEEKSAAVFAKTTVIAARYPRAALLATSPRPHNSQEDRGQSFNVEIPVLVIKEQEEAGQVSQNKEAKFLLNTENMDAGFSIEGTPEAIASIPDTNTIIINPLKVSDNDSINQKYKELLDKADAVDKLEDAQKTLEALGLFLRTSALATILKAKPTGNEIIPTNSGKLIVDSDILKLISQAIAGRAKFYTKAEQIITEQSNPKNTKIKRDLMLCGSPEECFKSLPPEKQRQIRGALIFAQSYGLLGLQAAIAYIIEQVNSIQDKDELAKTENINTLTSQALKLANVPEMSKESLKYNDANAFIAFLIKHILKINVATAQDPESIFSQSSLFDPETLLSPLSAITENRYNIIPVPVQSTMKRLNDAIADKKAVEEEKEKAKGKKGTPSKGSKKSKPKKSTPNPNIKQQ